MIFEDVGYEDVFKFIDNLLIEVLKNKIIVSYSYLL